MSRRVKKIFPPGTFIPFPQRLMAIGQLCLAFSLIIWYMAQPFMGEYFTLHSRMLLYEYAMGTSDVLKARPSQEGRWERQIERFKNLPENERQLVINDYQSLQNYAKRPITQKMGDGLRILLLRVPAFEQAWIFFSILIAILILLKREGAKQAAWLLPLLVMAYMLDNLSTGDSHTPPPDQFLFPSEHVIIEHYLSEPFASHPLEQKEQLEKGWQHYLIKNWSSNQEKSENMLEDAEFNFTLARLHALHTQSLAKLLGSFHKKLNPFLLLLYLLWNLLFACVMLCDDKFSTQSSRRRKIQDSKSL